jgi:S-DNA-T family DNA segregation ATPase FtsK/SpoIIIE
MPSRETGDEIRLQIKAVLLLAIAALCFAALNFPRQTGEVGLFINNVLRMVTGELAMAAPLIMALLALPQFLPRGIANLRQRVWGIILFLMILLVWAHMRLLDNSAEVLTEHGFARAALKLGYGKQGGGVLGGAISVLLFYAFKDIGSYIFIGAALLISFLLITNYSFSMLFRTVYKILAFLAGKALLLLKRVLGFVNFLFFSPGRSDPENGEAEDISHQETLFETAAGKPEKKTAEATRGEKPAAAALPKQPDGSNNPLVVETRDKPAITFVSGSLRDYTLPPLSLLARVPGMKDNQQQRTTAERARILEKTLESFGVRVRVSDVQSGPTVTRYEIQPETGVKVSKIVALADDLALNLAAPDVRIEAPIPGKAAVGIEVPNKVIAPVYLREVLEDQQFQNASSPLTIGLGKDITGVPVFADLMKMPHLMIAGSTGSGKSVCINTVIASILFKANPEEVKFVMIDPKVVELSAFEGIPHLLSPVVTDAKKAALTLRSMVKEMGRRYELFARETVRDIERYNEKLRQAGREEEQIPYIVVIIDELADLMMVAAADVEESIARLAQMSRAAGIHLAIATQRPSVDVITGVIKANITSRVAFAVSSMADSRTILDMGGAEKLLGRGDMLFHPIGIAKPFRVQGAFINDRELGALLDYIRSQGKPKFQEQLIPDEEADEEWYEEDEKFQEALLLVAETQSASISLLQRRLRLGYTRAARLIDDMERRGYVGRFEGSKAREVLITPQQAMKLLADKGME